MGRSTEDDREAEATLLRTLGVMFAPLPRPVTLCERLAFGPPAWRQPSGAATHTAS